jgi:serine/threonine protein kinase
MSFSSRFTKDELIAEGQTLTWKGHDTQTGANVVIKELHLKDRAQWKGLELFEREVQVLRQLDHPSIPRLLEADFGQEDPHVWTLAQEYIPGRDLRSAPSMDESAIRELAKQVLQILVYLQGFSPPLIHRDIKPANIILNDHTPFLVDFGAIQLVAPSDEGGSTIVGTSGYMPPEQLMGRTSPSSDLYGLGMTLVWLVTRCEPDVLPMTRMKIIWEPSLSMPVSRAFTEFINRMIAPLEEDRFSDANAALSALTERRNEALQVAPPSQTNLKLTSAGQEFEILLGPAPSAKPMSAFSLLVPLFVGLLITQLNVALGGKIVVLAALCGVTLAGIFISRAVIDSNTSRFRIIDGKWSLEHGKSILAHGPLSEIRGLSHVNFSSGGRRMALVCEHQTHALFDVTRLEEEWLKGELRVFLDNAT